MTRPADHTCTRTHSAAAEPVLTCLYAPARRHTVEFQDATEASPLQGASGLPTLLGVQAELKQPRFEEGLEGVLELASSISFSAVLQAADLDVAAKDDASTKAGAALQAVERVVSDAPSLV